MHKYKIAQPICLFFIVLPYVLFMVGCEKPKLYGKQWRLVALSKLETVQAYTDTLLMYEIRYSTPENVKNGNARRVMDSSYFRPSGPFDLNELDFSIGFDQSGSLGVNGNCKHDPGGYTYEISKNKMRIRPGERVHTLELRFDPNQKPYNRHCSTIMNYLYRTTSFTMKGKDTLILHNNLQNDLKFYLAKHLY